MDNNNKGRGADKSVMALFYLSNNPKSTTSDVAKGTYNIKSVQDLRNADRSVRYYFEEKFPHIIDCVEEDGKKRFSVKRDMVYTGVGKVDLVTPDGDELSMGLGPTLLYFDSENRPVMAVIGDGENVMKKNPKSPYKRRRSTFKQEKQEEQKW